MSTPPKPTKHVPDEVGERIRFDNRLPESMTSEIFAFVRELTEPMPDEEFFALRSFWRLAFDFFYARHDAVPEAQSAFQFMALLLSATNHRHRKIAPLPDSPYPTVADLKAENEALRVRVAELEAQNALLQIQTPPSPFETEAPKDPRAYTLPVSDIPIRFQKKVWDKDRFKDRDDFEQRKADADEQMEEERRKADDLWRSRHDMHSKHNIERRLRDQAYMLGINLGGSGLSADLLTFAEYQRRARETAVYKTTIFEGLNLTDDASKLARLLKLSYTVLGLAGEVGEFANIVKKIERDGKTIDEMLDRLVDELSDVFWYAFACADELGVPAEDVARHNLAKLAKRKADKTLHDNGNR